ncbi:zinc finger protein 436-like isoform X2 [Cheilinus undulatus]|uniref:zinc finger protein 436-like isoform X2 n=1 Tax=Cheilinus undulatus TaxID=241271 RepID=UPI001BD50444|nr:zinc finger protein 436-like isoform X2 [Cheilinus undulatus]
MFGTQVDFMEYELSKAEILRGIVTEKLSTAAREIFAVVERTVAGYEEEAAGTRQEIDRPRVILCRIGEIVRGIVTEKLTTAGWEIFAVVERTVAGYEEEAAGLRQEIDRQRIQLEAILRPRVTLCRIDEPECEEEADWEDGNNSWGGLSSHNQYNEESLAPSFHEDIKDPDFQMKNTRRPALKKRGRTTAFINLRVCLLQDSNINILKKGVLKSQLKEVRCPRGLQEAEFLDLLKVSFPQLMGEFDVFTINPTRRLKPLKLKVMTPEEIQKALKSEGKGRSALYIRLKGPNEPLSSQDTTNEEKPQASPEGAESNESDHLIIQSDRSAADSDSEDVDNEEEDDEKDVEWKPGSEDELKDKISGPHSSKRKKKAQVKRSVVKIPKSKPTKASLPVPLSCQVCKTLRWSNNKLIKHSWIHVEEAERLCGVCGEQSESTEELKNHLESHKKTYSCDICGKKFLSIYSLQGHAPIHTGVKPFKCDVCGKEFLFKNTLRNHRWEHVEDKPHKCDICNESFALKAKLMIHSRSHTDTKPYSCDLCGKSLCDLKALTRHKLIHSGEKRHGCQVCGKLFLTSGQLKVHEKNHTDRDKTYLCDICCKMFHTRGQLNAHLKIHSDEKVICSVCGRALSSKGHLKRHMRVHSGERPYKCSVCGRTYICSSHLNFHLKLHAGIKSCVCQVCGKAFFRREHLNNHMRTHDGKKPYRCTICGRGFTQSHSMKTHMKRHQQSQPWMH